MSFFKNLFGKKQEQEEEKVEKVEESAVLDMPAEDPFPSEWGSFSTYIDDKLASIRLNLALADKAPYPLYELHREKTDSHRYKIRRKR